MQSTTSSTLRTLSPSAVDRARAVAGIVTPTGWVLGVGSLAALVAGRALGWRELTTLGVMGLVLVAVAAAFLRGRSDLEVDVDLVPQRVAVGDRAGVQVTVKNVGQRSSPAMTMEMPIGKGVAEYPVARLPVDERHEELFMVPTVRRGVIPVGPARSVRSDPLSLLRRVMSWSEVIPLYVHPATTPLSQLGTGFVRDLEGTASNDISNADVAFHSLREYEPGDDRRLIHWLSTARTGTLMVRQFIDTRRSHVGVVVDGSAANYATADDFELALSIGASIGVRVLLDEQPLSMVVAAARVATAAGVSMLDDLAAVEVGGRRQSIWRSTERLLSFADGLSVAFLITGSVSSFDEVRKAASMFPSDVRVVAMRVVPGAAPEFQPFGLGTLMTIGSLDDLVRLLWAVGA